MLAAASLMLAWALDRLFGEPRSAWHPVAWFGRVAAPLGELARRRRHALAAFAAGAMLWFALVGSVAAAAYGLEAALNDVPAWLATPLLALAIKPAFAWRMLTDEVRGVAAALDAGLDAGRERVAMLCSRDVSQLDAQGVRETAIETLAENFNDSLVAPLFWFVVAGLPGAWAWRAANTLDAMWGYRGDWTWAGKWAARADDVLGWLPARLAALLLWLPRMALAPLRREAGRTPSPNGGWPMAAMALRVGARLGKADAYTLNRDAPAPDARALDASLVVAERGGRLAFVLAIALSLAIHAAAPALSSLVPALR
jgi:adenosylcobinamide-phosphate synthase